MSLLLRGFRLSMLSRIAINASLTAGRRPRLPEITTTWLEYEGVFQRTDDLWTDCFVGMTI
ncbi:hypothetical protein HQ587_05595 [bacterium]|nr:hypothetical protein [bacterium]